MWRSGRKGIAGGVRHGNGFVDLPLLHVAPPEQPLRETCPTKPELRADGRERSQSADQ
jgi:hypothetical protein